MAPKCLPLTYIAAGILLAPLLLCGMRTLLARTYAMIRKVPMSNFRADSEEIAAVLDGLKAEPSVQEHMRVPKRLEELEFRRKVAQERSKPG